MNTLAPEHAADTDPDLSDNEATITLDVICVVPVTINIKPGGGNPINLGAKGVIPVAVLTTTAGQYGNPLAFDATTIYPKSVRFGPANVVFDETGVLPRVMARAISRTPTNPTRRRATGTRTWCCTSPPSRPASDRSTPRHA